MEPPLLEHRVEAVSEKLQALDRVDGVHGPLERQVNVELLDQDQGLIDDQPALFYRETAGRREEFFQRRNRSQARVRCGVPRDRR